jgi:deazaflavin-dependent oxidoreductase (nitroreductase family)
VTFSAIAGGQPVLTVTTTGARTGQPRTTPLLGVPAGDDIALIGSSFGRPRNPGWYYNLRANPKAEVTYRDKTIRAIAREAATASGKPSGIAPSRSTPAARPMRAGSRTGKFTS